MPSRFFWIAIGYLALLVAVFVLYQVSPASFDSLSDSLGPLPLGVPWFGAVGGALVSLSGVFEHNQRWEPRFNYWHYSRPFVAGVIGSIAEHCSSTSRRRPPTLEKPMTSTRSPSTRLPS